GAVRPPVEAGTHRNDSGDSLNVAGILVIQGVEDVKTRKTNMMFVIGNYHRSLMAQFLRHRKKILRDARHKSCPPDVVLCFLSATNPLMQNR
ncbi:hypothetical protein, partial [Escherichia coli]|uniref:hypothetical protein n=2 Tax=Escherichia coli TaxID=562 RepID=UPI002157F8A7